MIELFLFGGLLGDVLKSLEQPKEWPMAPFNETVVIPGSVAAAAKDVHGGWQFDYHDDEAQMEQGSTRLDVALLLLLREDGTYRLRYTARWGAAQGFTASEAGTFKLSGEVLLLDPQATETSDLASGAVKNRQQLDNQSHVLIARVEKKKKLHVAGKCTQWQIDPICRVADNVWYSYKPSLAARKMDREEREGGQ